MRRIVLAGAVLLFSVCLFQGTGFAERSKGGGDPYQVMAEDLSGSAGIPANAKIAIMPFSYGDKEKSPVGTMVSERLTTRIVKLGTFKVIERQMLDNVLKELNLEGSGVVDAETTQKIGKVLGVDAIVTGTVLDLDTEKAEINARVIKSDTAEVIAAASAEVPVTWAAASVPPSVVPQSVPIDEGQVKTNINTNRIRSRFQPSTNSSR